MGGHQEARQDGDAVPGSDQGGHEMVVAQPDHRLDRLAGRGLDTEAHPVERIALRHTDPTFADEMQGPHGGAAGQAVISGDSDVETFSGESPTDQRLGAGRHLPVEAVRENDVMVPGEGRIVALGHVCLDELDADPGPLGGIVAKPPEHGGRERLQCTRQAADTHVPARAAAQHLEVGVRTGEERGDLDGTVGEDMAGFGEPQAASVALDEPRTGGPLRDFELLAERAGRTVGCFRDGCEGAAVTQLTQQVEVGHIHHHSEARLMYGLSKMHLCCTFFTPHSDVMHPRDRLAAVIVALLWGTNFTAIHASLQTFPPLMCAAIRFLLLAAPTVLFVRRPVRADGTPVPLRWLVGYGLGFGVAQFLFLYTGMAAGMPTGLASLVLQASGPFTLMLGALLLHEPVRGRQWVGLALAGCGLSVVGIARATTASAWPFVLVLLGALGWAFGNLASRQARPADPLRLTMWMSVVPPLPLAAMSLVVEGPDRIGAAAREAVTTAAIPAWLGIAYTVLLATVVGSGLWTWLLSRHPAGVVAPFSMLVPVVGIAVAALALGETPSLVELAGGVLVIAGVFVGSGATLRRARQGRASPSDAAEALRR